MEGSLGGRQIGVAPRVLVLCAHLHEDRARKQDRDYLQPMAGLHIASLIDRDRYRVTLYHEMWHGPYDATAIVSGAFALVFLTGLQMDFDRMRQLSYFFRRAGAVVVAGGSICTLFPDFARQYFDVVCAGGVDSVRDVMRDFDSGALRPIYYRAQHEISRYAIDHRLTEENGISVPVHFIEASRGCNFKCDFCSLPAENASHAVYDIDDVMRNIDDSIASGGRVSRKRLYPMVWFIDNNFSNNLPQLREICRRFKADRRIKMWGALVTQDLLRNRELLRQMAEAKCHGIFTGIESLDAEFIEAHEKKQNVKGSSSLLDDIAYAESLGMVIDYGYLFDPRMASIAEMKAELRRILQSDLLHYPYFLAFVAPLAGTRLFWEAADRGDLLPELRLRDLDGRCIAYRNTKDDLGALGDFAATIFGRPHVFFDRRKSLRRFVAYAWRNGLKHPLLLYLFYENRARLGRLGRKHSKARRRTYVGGRDVLDPQYQDFPADITPEDKARYFDPILVTDAAGRPAPWLERYRPPQAAVSRLAEAPTG